MVTFKWRILSSALSRTTRAPDFTPPCPVLLLFRFPRRVDRSRHRAQRLKSCVGVLPRPVDAQGSRVRSHKEAKAPPAEIKAEVAKLLELKKQYKELTGEVRHPFRRACFLPRETQSFMPHQRRFYRNGGETI